jgi:hypothetical protein
MVDLLGRGFVAVPGVKRSKSAAADEPGAAASATALLRRTAGADFAAPATPQRNLTHSRNRQLRQMSAVMRNLHGRGRCLCLCYGRMKFFSPSRKAIVTLNNNG